MYEGQHTVFDFADEINLRSLQAGLYRAEVNGRAQQAALEEHPVAQFVRDLPVESTLYPAIRYLRPNELRELGKVPRINSGDQETIQGIIQEISSENDTDISFDDREISLDLNSFTGKSIQEIEYDIQETLSKKASKGIPETYNDFLRSWSETQRGTLDAYCQEGVAVPVQSDNDDPYIVWSMPAHDLRRPVVKGCGFITSSDSSGPVYVCCDNDLEHHCKAKRRHCWSLSCPSCMNDTALKNGIEVERQLLTFQCLSRKQGTNVGKIKHWVISPPQENAKLWFQRADSYDSLCKYVQDSMMECGSLGGFMITHPWRQKKDLWEFSPHFHILSYGRINTKYFLKTHPGWIIKLVHSGEGVRSIRHTAAYLFTHMGLPKSERPIDEVDFGTAFMQYMMPGFTESVTQDQKDGLSPWYHFTDRDIELRAEDKGKMVGDLSGMDWVQWTMDLLTKDYRTRYFGGVSRSKMKLIGTYRQFKARRCKECGCLLKIHDGFNDNKGKQANYIHDIGVYAFAKDYNAVIAELNNYRSILREQHLTVIDFAQAIPNAISTDELGLEKNSDIVLEHPLSLVTIHGDGSISQEIAG